MCANGDEMIALLIEVDDGLVRRFGSAKNDDGGAIDEPERFRWCWEVAEATGRLELEELFVRGRVRAEPNATMRLALLDGERERDRNKPGESESGTVVFVPARARDASAEVDGPAGGSVRDTMGTEGE